MPDLVLRPHQVLAEDGMRAGFRNGHKRQMLYMPTGAGKTASAASMMRAADARGTKSCFLVDRRAIVNQTSASLDRYGIDHGVIMADHVRVKPGANIQVASAQTLESRGFYPGLSLLCYDEAHVMRSSFVKFVEANPDVYVVGLTATPFTPGLSKVYTNVVSVTTTDELIEQGWLVPVTAYAAKAPDMTGAKIVAGEWDESEIEQRGTQIIGDIVQEWVEKTRKHFGGPVKTAVFSATVAHGDELCRQFQAAGYMFEQVSYKSTNAHREALLGEFAKPDSKIMGLVSCEALGRGWDQVDILCGISARPYRKSFSSHIQQLGRVMRPSPGKESALWLCIEKGSRVLTQRGLVPIEAILLSDKIWDGQDFVSHQGAVCRGVKRTIAYAGLRATADHPVWTQEGWRPFGLCAKEQIPIATTGFGWKAVRESEGYFSDDILVGSEAKASHARYVRVRRLRISSDHISAQSGDREDRGVSELRPAAAGIPSVAVCKSVSDEGPLHTQEEQAVFKLRGARHRIPLSEREAGGFVDHEEPGHPLKRELLASSGQNQSRWPLRTWEPALVGSEAQHEQSAWHSSDSENACVSPEVSRDTLRRCDAENFAWRWHDCGADCGEVSETFEEAEREVWDILCCGPLNRFTVEGLLVHNCHAGNYVRFYKDMRDLFANGVTSLSEAEKKDSIVRKEPTPKEKKELACGVCGYVLVPGAPCCPACGHQRMRKSLVETLPGELVPFDPDAKKAPEKTEAGLRLWTADKAYTWAQLCGEGVQRKKGDMAKAKKWALSHYKALYNEWPSQPFDGTRPPMTDIALRGRITAQTIRWAHSPRFNRSKA